VSSHLTELLEQFGGPLDSALTPDGVPLEVSLSEGSEAFRYVIDPGAGQPNFEARLAAARDMASPAEFDRFVDTLFPHPDQIDPAARFSIWLGAVGFPGRGPNPVLLRNGGGPCPAGGRNALLKVYGNLRLDHLSLDRLAQQWPAYAALGDHSHPDLFEPMGAALVVNPDGGLTHKLYVSPWEGLEHQAIEHLATRYRVDARIVFDQVRSHGLSRLLWGPSVVMSLQPTGFSLYVATLPLYRQGTDVLELARTVAARRDGMQAQLERLLDVSTTPWRVTWFGWSFSPSSPGSRLTIYLAPGLGDLHHLDPAVAHQKAPAGGQIGRQPPR
jgi:hypothetical protein